MATRSLASSLEPRLSGRADERLREHDRVLLTESVPTDQDELPEGSAGTIVSIWSPGEAYEVEFTQPFAALVTLRPAQIRAVRPGAR